MNLEQMMERQAQNMAEQDPITPEVAESVNPEQVEQPPTPEPPAEAPVPDAEQEPPATPEIPADVETPTPTPESQFDPNKFLEESSEGLFKSVDDFKSSLSKVKEFDELKAKYDAKEQEVSSISPFAKKLIELEKSGKTQDQIDTFIKINRLGDLSQLDPKEIKIQRLMFDGYKRDVAERKVVRDFGLNVDISSEDLSEDEIFENKMRLEDAQEELRISSQEDLRVLNDLVAKVEQSQDDDANTKLLKEQAVKIEYSKKLEPVAELLAKEFVSNRAISFTNGQEKVSYELPFDENYSTEVAKAAKDFFLETGNPVNDETVGIFNKLIKGEYLVENFEKTILPNVFGDGYSKGYEAAKKEVENRSGLPVSGLPPVTDDSTKLLREQQRRAANE